MSPGGSNVLRSCRHGSAGAVGSGSESEEILTKGGGKRRMIKASNKGRKRRERSKEGGMKRVHLEGRKGEADFKDHITSRGEI